MCVRCSRTLVIALTTAVVLLTGVTSAGARIGSSSSDGDAWLTYRHDAQRTGRSSSSGPTSARLLRDPIDLEALGFRPFFDGQGCSTGGVISLGLVSSTGDYFLTGAVRPEGGTSFSVEKLLRLTPNGTVTFSDPAAAPSDCIHRPNIGPDGNIYVGTTFASRNFMLQSFSPEGVLRLSRDYAEVPFPGFWDLVAAPDGVLYAANRQPDGRKFLSVNLDGSVRWSDPGVGISTTWLQLAVSQQADKLFVGAVGSVQARRTSDGSLLWQRLLSAGDPHSPAVAPDGSVLIVEHQPRARVWNLAPDDGAVNWSLNLSGSMLPPCDFTPQGAGKIAVAADGAAIMRVAGGNPTRAALVRVRNGAIVGIPICVGDADSNTVVGDPVLDSQERMYIDVKICPTAGGACRFELRAYASDGTLLFAFPVDGEIVGEPVLGPDGSIFVATLRTLYVLAPRPSAMDDDFNDNSLDRNRWSKLVPPPGFTSDVSETNQRLEISVGPGAGGAGIVSRCSVSGNFDVRVDYTLLDWPANNSHGLRLLAPDLGAASIERRSDAAESYTFVAGGSANQTPTSDSTGSLRLTRAGSTLSGYYRAGSSWVPVGSGPVPTGNTGINLDLGTNDPNAPAVKAAFDNFVVTQGAVVCPSPPPPATLIVKKVVVNDDAGTKTPSDFSFQVNGGPAQAFEADGQSDLAVDAGIYTVTEPPVEGYSTSYDNCSGIKLSASSSATCTITNNDAVIRSWEGIYDDSGVSPSDSTGAIGPTRYIELVNRKYAIYDRATNPPRELDSGSLKQLTDDRFVGNTALVDPQIIWDPASNRFYYSVLRKLGGILPKSLDIGFSKTDSPNSASDWCHYTWRFVYLRGLPDQPKLGTTRDFLLIGVVRLDAPSEGGDVLWLSKPPPGSKCPAWGSLKSGRMTGLKDANGDPIITPVPAIQVDPDPVGWIVSSADVGGGPSKDYLTIFRLTKDARTGRAIIEPGRSVKVPQYSRPPPAPQAGTSKPLNTIVDGRLTTAISAIDPSQGGAMVVWTQHTVATPPVSGDAPRSELRWYEIDVAFSAVLRKGVVSDPSLYVFNGAISPDRVVNGATAAYGDSAVVGFNTSSPTTHVAVQMVVMAGGRQSPFVLIKQSAGPNVDGSCADPGECRTGSWGDYSAATPDPGASTSGPHGQVWLTNMWNVPSTDDQGVDWRTWNWATALR